MKGFQRYLLAGLLTAIPVLVTWVVFDFVLGLLADVGGPLVRLLSRIFDQPENTFGRWLLHPWTQWVLAILVTLLGLYLLGLAASWVIGRRAIGLFHRLVARVPFIQKVYGGTKQFVDTLQSRPDDPRMAVLVEYPQPGQKALGVVTRVIKDKDTGEEIAVVYVPAAPVPTSGHLQFIPLSKVIRTDLTYDQAMTFLLTGGTQGPDTIRFSVPGPLPLTVDVTAEDEKRPPAAAA